MGWLSGWSWAKEISLTGQTGAGTLYQVDLDIGASAGGDFHLEGHCTNFPQDIEVTDNDGTTLLDFSIEDITADPLKMWVEVADDLGSNQKIWVYYGKSGATTNSDIEATFLLGDDFPGTSLNLTKWDVNAGTPAVSDGLTLSGEVEAIWSDNSFGPLDISFRSRVQVGETNRKHELGLTDSTNPAATGKVADTDVNSFGIQLYNDGNLYSCANNGSGAQTQVNEYAYNTNYHIYEFSLISGSAKFYDDEVEQREETSNIPTGAMPAWFNMRESVGSINVDWVLIRKYNSPEPVFASAGAEQSAPAGHPTMRRWGGIPGMQYTGRRSW